MAHEITERGHLGDGVYLSDDGFHLWLAANHHDNKVIALEPSVFIALVRAAGEIYGRKEYAARLREIASKLSPEA